MRITFTHTDLKAALDDARDDVKQHNTSAMLQATDALKKDLRDQVTGAGLGGRLANTWRSKNYPPSGVAMNPAGLVISKAPKLIDAFDSGPTIVPVNGQRYLAIPTDNVPPKAGGRGGARKMTPLDVEVAFNQDLIIRKARTGNLLAFVNVVKARNGRGYRRATKGRVAAGRQAELILMFVLVRSVTLQKRLDIQAAADRGGARLASLLQSGD